jgi:hypothetical protein
MSRGWGMSPGHDCRCCVRGADIAPWVISAYLDADGDEIPTDEEDQLGRLRSEHHIRTQQQWTASQTDFSMDIIPSTAAATAATAGTAGDQNRTPPSRAMTATGELSACPMFSNHAQNIDARGSTFVDIGRDQIINNTTIIYQTNYVVPSSSSRPAPRRLSAVTSDLQLRPSPDGGPLFRQPAPNRMCTLPEVTSMVESAVVLIIQIAHLLIDSDQCNYPNYHLHLVHELKSSHQILTMTGLAIQDYANRPLSQSLADMVQPKVMRCVAVLQDLLDTVNGTRQGLDSTIISKLWPTVWQWRWDGRELSSLRRSLCDSRKSHEGFLVALHSYVLFDFHASTSTEYSSL